MRSWVSGALDSLKNPLIRNFSLIALLLYILWLYFPPYANFFVGDDYVQFWRIREFVDAPLRAYRVFNPLWTDWYFRPLQHLWFLINRLIFQLDPLAYYYLQLSLHLVAATLIFALSKKLRLGSFFAFLATAIFAAGGLHQLTIAWISSIGNIFSAIMTLSSLIVFLNYLNRPDKRRLLLYSSSLAFLGLLSHELGIILPIFLIGLRILWPVKKRVVSFEIFTLLAWVLIIILYIYLQISRPNANVSASGMNVEILISSLSPARQIGYLFALIAQWFDIDNPLLINPGVTRPATVELAIGLLLPGLFLLLLGLVRKLNMSMMFVAYWLVFQLAFVYFALWLERPEILDSRHLYSAWAALSVFIAGLFQFLLYRKAKSSSQSSPLNYRPLAGGLVVLLLLIIQHSQIKSFQASIENHVLQIASREQQLKDILPNVSSETRLYANNFDLTAPYFAPAAAIWYGNSKLEGGTLSTLKLAKRVTNDSYLFDTNVAGLYNLMPELQDYGLTRFIWSQGPEQLLWLHEDTNNRLDSSEFMGDQVIGPVDDKRLAFSLNSKASGWVSVRYDDQILFGSSLAFAIMGEPGQSFRLILRQDSELDDILFEYTISPAEQGGWQEFLLPVENYWGQSVSLLFETDSGGTEKLEPGYWSNPRFVMD